MDSTVKQMLRDPDTEPTAGVIEQILGEGNYAYLTFLKCLADKDIQLEWRYYNDGKAWLGKGICRYRGARGGIKEQTVFWLSVWEGFFKVTIYFPEKERNNVLSLDINEEIKKKITESCQMGKLKFFPVVFDLNSEDMFQDIFILMNFRKNIK